VLFGICYVNLASNACFSVLASFFDKVSEDHGASKSEVGFIFAIFAGINVIVSPIFGYLIPIIGINFMFISGMTLAGGCALLFSCVDLLHGRLMYITFCIIIRSVQAIGCSMYFTTAMTILSVTWGQRLSLAMGFYEISTGLGMIIGPLLGGWLYSVGGFALPFYVVGGMMLFGAILNLFLVPTIETGEVESGSIIDVLKSPGVLITSLMQLVTWSGMDFNIPFLEPLLAQSGVSGASNEVLVGILFMIMAVAYIVISPIAGLLSDKYDTKATMVFGNICIAISYALLGPADCFKMGNATLTTIIISMVILGVGLAAAIVPSMADMVVEAKRSGMSDTIGTEAIVGGYFNSIVFLGEFLGPVIGGCLIDKYNNIITATSIFGFGALVVTIFAMICYLGLHLYRRFPCPGYREEYSEEEISSHLSNSMASTLAKSGTFGPRQYSLSISMHTTAYPQ